MKKFKLFKSLTRYILKEHIWPFLFAISLLTLIFLLNILFRDLGRILSRGIPVTTFLEFLGFNLAWIFALSVPMGVLVSTLFTFGKLSAENEITAIKASGISFFQILKPVLITGIIFAVGLVIYNNTILPNFNHKARLLTEDIYRKSPTIKIEPNVVFTDLPDINLFTKKIIEEDSTARMENVIIDDLTDSQKRKTILAKWGTLIFDTIYDRLIMDLYDGEIHEIDYEEISDYRKGKFNHHRISVDVPGLSLKRSTTGGRSDREKSESMMKEDIKKHIQSIERREGRIASTINLQFTEVIDTFLINLLDDPATTLINHENIPVSQLLDQSKTVEIRLKNWTNQINQEKRLIRSYRRNINALKVEIQKKYSIPAVCIIFIFVGAPLGILTKKGNMGVAVGISMLFFLMFWVSLIQGEILADRLIVSPAVAMWAANVIVAIIGLILLLITSKEYRPSLKRIPKPKKVNEIEK